MLAWACTVHKIQGLSLIQIVVSFQLLKQRQINYGQIYVALSRVTTLEGMYIIGTFTEDSIRANPFALVEYRRYPSGVIDSDTFECKILNKHVTDLALDESLTKSDIICLIEIQLIPNSDIPEIAILQGFEVVTMTIRIDSKVLQCAQKLIHI